MYVHKGKIPVQMNTLKKIKETVGKKPSKWKNLFKKEKRAVVNVHVANTNLLSPMERERSVYFKEEWEEAKKQVFFAP